MSDYQNQQEMEENQRNPKNRFLGLFCHANQVDSSWGLNWPFWCGVLMFSIVIGIISIYDFSVCATHMRYFKGGLDKVFYLLRILSNVVALIGIIFAALSIIKTSFQYATIAYYTEILSFIINTVFIIYFLFFNFLSRYWYELIIWGFCDFILLLFLWILFCNMVDIGRKIRQAAASNTFQ